jgi:hypothetical protein
MSKNYTAIHYIQHELKNYDPGFVNCVVRCFNIITPTDEKTHGFNHVDDSPQIF